LVVRGVLAVIFGVLIIASPGMALQALILVLGIYFIVDGIFAIAGAIAHRAQYQHWWLTLIEGIIGIIAGIIAIVYPGLTAFTLLYVLAIWAILTGIFEIIAAARLRQAVQGEWLLVLAGVLSVVFGVLIILFPGTGILAILGILAGYAIIFGILLIVLGFRMRSMTTGVTGTHAPTPA
jgi:uncharacterized membrane protein HdeD (DUF308 family)